MKKRENKSPSRSAKRALTSSVLALVLCFVMLLGTTFAWFTDTASTGVNKIQAGTLDIALEMKNDDGTWVNAEGQTLNFIAADGNENILWEPGCWYETGDIRVTNNGNLALKFKLEVTGLGGDEKLNEAIEWDFWSFHENDPYGWINTEGIASHSIQDEEFVLLPGECVCMALAAWMDEDVGNEYQGLSIDGAAITVYATQWTYEYDSVDNQYDAGAEYAIPVSSASDLKDAIAAGQDVVLTESVTFTKEDVQTAGRTDETAGLNAGNYLLWAKESMNIDLNGHVIEYDGSTTDVWEGILATGKDVTVNVYDSSEDKSGGITLTNSEGCALYATNGATLNVYSGKYSTSNVVVAVAQGGGTMNIYGGTYESTCPSNDDDYAYVSKVLLHGVNENKNTNQINVYGGSYKGFDPSKSTTKVSVADGYKVTEANGWYTVSK